jgi:aspartate aminotransferase-like enzyme
MMPAMEQNLRIPGPTPLPHAVREAQAASMIDHRGTEFAEMLREISTGIAGLIGHDGDALLLTGSGTGSMEAAVVNTLSPGDRVLSVNTGGFGDRFAAIATAFGAQVESLAFEWGMPADPALLREHLASADPYAAVLITHNETSTGVTNPLRSLVAEVRSAPGDPLAVVDGISGLGAIPFEMDAWGVDVVVSASQKAWMASPGIAIAAVSQRADVARQKARMPRFYWDFGQAATWSVKGQTPWTPAVSVLFGLRIGVQRLVAEGTARTWARHEALARATEAGLQALGMRLVAADGYRSATVTAAWLPAGIEWPTFNAAMRARGLAVAGGQGKLAGKILRFGHMGDVSLEELSRAIGVMGDVLPELGVAVDGDAAVEATRVAFREATQAAA